MKAQSRCRESLGAGRRSSAGPGLSSTPSPPPPAQVSMMGGGFGWALGAVVAAVLWGAVPAQASDPPPKPRLMSATPVEEGGFRGWEFYIQVEQKFFGQNVYWAHWDSIVGWYYDPEVNKTNHPAYAYLGDGCYQFKYHRKNEPDNWSETLQFKLGDVSCTWDQAPFVPAFVDDGKSEATSTYPKDRTFTVDATIDTVEMTRAEGGDGALTYTLNQSAGSSGGNGALRSSASSSSVPSGLTFNGATRKLSGTPTASQAATTYDYTVTDRDGDSHTLTFTMEVKPTQAPPPEAVAGDSEVTLSWEKPADTGISGWEVTQDGGSNWSALTTSEDTSTTPATLSATVGGLTNGTAYTFQIRAYTGRGADRLPGAASASVTATPVPGSPSDPPPDPNKPDPNKPDPDPTPPTRPPTRSPGSGSGGGGGGGSPDRHGNTPARATVLTPAATAPWAVTTTGQINSGSDIDYFQIPVPQAGVLVVETRGTTNTQGTVWQAEEELAHASSGGARQNFRLATRVEAGLVLIAVASEGNRTGAYTLALHVVAGYLGNPAPGSAQSGVGLLSGWVCEAEEVEIEFTYGETGEVETYRAGYGTIREDTESICGDEDNGFGLLWNWNRLGDGVHTVRAFVDGVELGVASVTVTTLGEEFARGLSGRYVLLDFPRPGEAVYLHWSEARQNFVLGPAEVPVATGDDRPGSIEVGFLGNPAPHSLQSGVGVISGWVCEAEGVEIEFTHGPTGALQTYAAAYGTIREDTEEVCGDEDNGFGLLWNWNRLGEGVHTVRALVDGEELGRATVTVTTLGEEFVRGLRRTETLVDFPTEGQVVTVVWQQAQQNFVITGVE